MTYGVIYLITNQINGKQYVGQTTRDVKVRFKEHCNNKHYTSLLTHSINKYGKDNFTVEIIDDAKTREEINNKEIYWIEKLDTVVPNGLNISHGGEGITGVIPHNVKKVIELDTLKVFDSITDASKYFNVHSGHITLVCRGEIGHLGGYKFAYLEDYKNNTIPKFKHKGKRKVINIDTEEVFDSITDACNKYELDKSSLSKACRGKIKYTGGYRWAYLEEFLNNTYPVKKSHKKRVINTDTGEVFDSITDASIKYNISSGSISNTCNKKQNKSKGFHWQYYEEYLEQQKAS